MNEAEPSSQGNEKSKRKRSIVEQILVWGGILLLLFVVLLEWRSQAGYDSSLNALDQKLAKQTMPLAELPGSLHGFHTQEEIKHGDRRELVLTWPSLFKQYKLRVFVSEAKLVTHCEKFEAVDEFAKPTILKK